MSEKIDLEKISATASTMPEHWIVPQQMLALVRAVRAIRAVRDIKGWELMTPKCTAAIDALDAALAPFTDGAEVSSDGREHKDHCAYWARKEAGR